MEDNLIAQLKKVLMALLMPVKSRLKLSSEILIAHKTFWSQIFQNFPRYSQKSEAKNFFVCNLMSIEDYSISMSQILCVGSIMKATYDAVQSQFSSR